MPTQSEQGAGTAATPSEQARGNRRRSRSIAEDAKEEAKALGIDYYDNRTKGASSGAVNVGFYGQARAIASSPARFSANVSVRQALEILSNGSCGD